MKPVTIIVADDHPMIRDVIKMQIESNCEWQIIGEAEDGVELVEMAKEMVPDVVIVDLEMPRMRGDAAIRAINDLGLGIKSIVISGFFHETNLKRVFDAGACAAVTKTAATEELTHAIEHVIDGSTYLSPKLAEILEHRKDTHTHTTLTDREKQILTLIAEGKSRKEISEMQLISPWTVDKHRSNIKTKLGFANVAEMVRYAITNGYVSSTFDPEDSAS